MIPEKRLHTTLLDEEGEPLEEQEHETNSIVIGFPAILAEQFGQGLNQAKVNDITGTSRDIERNRNNLQFAFRTGTADPGVHFGTGSTSVSFDDTDLDSRLTSGVTYNNGSVNINQTTSQSDIELTRTLNNNSGSTLDIKEAGIVLGADNVANQFTAHLAARDTLDSTVSLGAGKSLVGTYTFTFKV
jgi:hypothetical protein